MKFFLKHLKVNRNGALVTMVFQLGMFLMGVLIVLCVNAFVNEDRDYAAIGGMVALIGVVFGGLLRGSGGASRYRMAVSMGNTRLSYILADPLITALNCVIGIGVAWLLDKFELWLYGVLYPGWELDFDIFQVFAWWHAVLLTVGICALDFLFGALQLRFGAKGFALVWFPCCFLPMITSSSVHAAQGGGTSLLAWIGRGILFLAGALSPAMWCAVGIALLLVLVVLSVLCYRKAEVRMI